MLRFYAIKNRHVIEQPVTPSVVAEIDWIDAQEPDEPEREQLQSMLRTELPESEEVEEIEASARFFVDTAGIHIHSLFLAQSEGRHATVSVACILQPERLITVHETDLADFRLLRMRLRRRLLVVDSPADLLMTLFEQKIENLADALEDIHRGLEKTSYLVLEDEEAALEDAIDQLAKLEDSNGKIHLCLMDTQRTVTFLLRHLQGKPEIQQRARDLTSDLDTLMSHTTFLFNKINFLMDSTQGFINIEQNQIIKIFSIAAVVFLPPTLIASIYGMNFAHMPELEWLLGYPWAIVLMVLSGIAPYWYFKRKGWL